MRSGEYCISAIDKLVEEGCISKERASELKAWQGFREEKPEISGLSEGACKPLMREQDEEIQAEAIQKVGRAIEHGRIPTAKQTEQLLENARQGVKRMGRPHKTYTEYDAEDEIVRALRKVLKAGLPPQDLRKVVDRAVFEVVTPDGGCACQKEM